MGCVADQKDATLAVAVGDEGPGTPGHRAVNRNVEVCYTDQRPDHRNRLGGSRIRINGVQVGSGSQGEPVVVASVAADEQQGTLSRGDHCADPPSAQCRLEVGIEQDAKTSSWNRL